MILIFLEDDLFLQKNMRLNILKGPINHAKYVNKTN